MESAPGAPTLGDLLDRRELSLRAVTRIPRAERDTVLRWAHSSDLADPTPFLDERVVLLTTGAQLAETDADTYVARLLTSGIAALGFGSGVVRKSVPDELVQACEDAGVPLFEVPYRTPFLAVVRAAADMIAAHGFARRSWALTAQRGVALAALRDAPLASAIAELGRQLAAWVGLFDPVGELSVSHPATLPDTTSSELRDAARRILAKGAPAADTVTCGGRAFTLQTLGRADHLRGLLAFEGTQLDQEARGVVTTVVAMAGLALERESDLARAQGSLRSGVLRALLRGDVAFARDVAGAAWTRLPAEPVRALAVRGGGADLLAYLETRAAHAPGELFFAPSGDDIVVLVTDGADPLADAWPRFRVAVGISRPAEYSRVAAAIDEALTAVPVSGSAEFAPGAADLLRAPSDDQIASARAFLGPLRRRDEREGTSLETSLRVWLENDANRDRAAAALGIHRHTMRARIAQASADLGRDLVAFDARAELWAAMRVADVAARPGTVSSVSPGYAAG